MRYSVAFLLAAAIWLPHGACAQQVDSLYMEGGLQAGAGITGLRFNHDPSSYVADLRGNTTYQFHRLSPGPRVGLGAYYLMQLRPGAEGQRVALRSALTLGYQQRTIAYSADIYNNVPYIHRHYDRRIRISSLSLELVLLNPRIYVLPHKVFVETGPYLLLLLRGWPDPSHSEPITGDDLGGEVGIRGALGVRLPFRGQTATIRFEGATGLIHTWTEPGYKNSGLKQWHGHLTVEYPLARGWYRRTTPPPGTRSPGW